ncbi:MAG: hypothetical protein ACKO8U_19685, partial [Pirellula sp.]
GVGFSTITFAAGDGKNVLVNWGANGTTLRMFAGSGDDRFQNNADGVGLLEFNAGQGDNALQNNGSGVGQIVMTGQDGNDTLLNSGNLVQYILFTGNDGDDSLVNTGSGIGRSALAGSSNTGLRFIAGNGVNVLRTQGINLSTLYFQGGEDADSLVYNTTLGGSIEFIAGAGKDSFTFRGSASSIDVDLGIGADKVVYSGSVESESASNPTVKFLGNTGDDSFEFIGSPKGYVELTELYSGITDTSRDSLDFSAYLAGSITIDLASTSKQQLGNGFWVQFPSSSVMGIENVRGSQAGDTIYGNDRPNTLSGARYLSSPPTGALARSRSDQWVLLDFDTQTQGGEYVYTAADRDKVLEGMRRAYYGINSDGTIRQYSDPGRWFNVR